MYYTVSYKSGKKCCNISYLNAARNFTCCILSFIEHINFNQKKQRHGTVRQPKLLKSTLHHMPQKILLTSDSKWYSLASVTNHCNDWNFHQPADFIHFITRSIPQPTCVFKVPAVESQCPEAQRKASGPLRNHEESSRNSEASWSYPCHVVMYELYI